MTKLEFLAMSLPYGLRVYVKYNHKPRSSEIEKMVGIVENSIITDVLEEGDIPLFVNEYGLCLRPLSDLDSYNSNSPMNLTMTHLICTSYSLQRLIENRIAINTLSMVDALELIKHHFDIADLIPIGEAIDINTLSINPYK